MNKVFDLLFGHGKDLDILQMSCRAIAVFIIAFILIRIAGRRSFGLHGPLDNIISILLGAILSRAVVGASPFFSVVACSFAIVVIHRLLGWLIVRYEKFSVLFEGRKILLFENDHFIIENLRRALVCEEDVMQGLRRTALTNDLNKIDKIYMERNGEISVVKK